jgi:hypothetical protein
LFGQDTRDTQDTDIAASVGSTDPTSSSEAPEVSVRCGLVDAELGLEVFGSYWSGSVDELDDLGGTVPEVADGSRYVRVHGFDELPGWSGPAQLPCAIISNVAAGELQESVIFSSISCEEEDAVRCAGEPVGAGDGLDEIG